MFKDGTENYRPGAHSWRKYRVRDTLEMVVGAVTGAPSRPRILLLGRHDAQGRMRYAGHTSAMPAAQARGLDDFLRSAQKDHPRDGRSFSAGWGSQEKLTVSLVVPETIVEASVHISRDARGRLRHPVRFVRLPADMAVEDVPPFEVRRPEGGGR
ncbi:hypothetical protein ACWD3Z_00245 [Streptomyces sp. NPDC002740]